LYICKSIISHKLDLKQETLFYYIVNTVPRDKLLVTTYCKSASSSAWFGHLSSPIGYACRIGPYPSVFGRRDCASWWQYFIDCWQSIRDLMCRCAFIKSLGVATLISTNLVACITNTARGVIYYRKRKAANWSIPYVCNLRFI
jgi:hypothetical protein